MFNKMYLSLFFIILLVITVVLSNIQFSRYNNVYYGAVEMSEQIYRVKVTNFSETGQIKNILWASHWGYCPQKELSILKQLHIIILHKPEKTWHIFSKTANVVQKDLESHISKISLKDGVQIYKNIHDQRQIDLETLNLEYYPQQEYFETDQFVTLKQHNLKVSGTGLKGYLDSNQIIVLQHKETVYVPSKF